jgi:hypothetical protein
MTYRITLEDAKIRTLLTTRILRISMPITPLIAAFLRGWIGLRDDD